MMRAKTRSSTRSKKSPARGRKPTITASIVQGRVPYLEVKVGRAVTETTMVQTFEGVIDQVRSSQNRRVLVDLGQVSVRLSISDLNDLAKLVQSAGGMLDRLSLLLRHDDIPEEKFFERSVNNRGVATLVTDDADEAAYWLTAPLRRSS